MGEEGELFDCKQSAINEFLNINVEDIMQFCKKNFVLLSSVALTGTVIVLVYKIICFVQNRCNSVIIFMIFTGRKRNCGRVMFSVVSVCHFGHRKGVPCDHYP